MKLFVLFTLLTAVLISGCIDSQSVPAVSSSPTQFSTETTTTTTTTTTGTTTSGETDTPTVTRTSSTGDAYPSLTTTVGPSNPSLGETFTLTVSAEDDEGLVVLGWETSNYFSNQGPSDSFSCNSQKTCSNSWEFLTIEEGLPEIKITVVDTWLLLLNRI